MIVFIEDTIIESFLVTYFMLNIVFCFINEKKSKLRIVVACLFSSIIALCYPLLKLNDIAVLLLKLFVNYLIVLIAYKTTNLKHHLFFLTMFCFVSAIYSGVNAFIYYTFYGSFAVSKKLPTILVIFVLFAVCYLLNECKKVLYKKKSINNFTYDVVLQNGTKVVKTKAYLDTGNILIDKLTNKPVCLTNFKTMALLNENFKVEQILTNSLTGLKFAHFIPVKTVNTTNKILAFQIDSLKIKNNNKTQVFTNPMLALSKVKITGFNCDVVLNSKLLGD